MTGQDNSQLLVVESDSGKRTMSKWIDQLADNLKSSDIAEQKRRDRLALKRDILSSNSESVWRQLVDACKTDVQALNEKLAEKFPNDHTRLIDFQFIPSRAFTIRRGYHPSFQVEVSFEPEQDLVVAKGQKSPRPQNICGISHTFRMDVDEATGAVVLTRSGAPMNYHEVSRLLIESCLK